MHFPVIRVHFPIPLTIWSMYIMGYSYFPTERAANKWATANLNYVGFGPVVIRELSKYEQTDKRKWYAYYYLRAIK